MFKYTKRLLSDICFWCQECKIRRKENAEWERIEDEDFFFSAELNPANTTYFHQI